MSRDPEALAVAVKVMSTGGELLLLLPPAGPCASVLAAVVCAPAAVL
jgi:hypothetical protein